MNPVETALLAAFVSIVAAYLSSRYQKNKPMLDSKSADKMKADIEEMLWNRVKGELDELTQQRDAALEKVKQTMRDLEDALNHLEAALERADALEASLARLSDRVATLEAENKSLRLKNSKE